MTVTLLLGEQNKRWCEDCWASYSSSNSGLATYLWQISSWLWEARAVVPSPFKLCMYNYVLGDLYMALSSNPSFWKARPGGLEFDSHMGKKLPTLTLVYHTIVYRKYLYTLCSVCWWCF